MDDLVRLLGDFDANAYLRALIAVVKVHGVEEVERQFVETRARVLGVDPSHLWDEALVELPPILGSMSDTTRRVVLRDCIFIACIDGEYTETERVWIHRIRDWLGLGEQTADLFEDWCRRYFDLMSEQEALLLGFEPPIGRFVDPAPRASESS